MGYQIFIDGQAGTTGLQVAERLLRHPQVSLITLADDERKSASARRDAFAAADAAILCLPDEAAIQAAEMTEDLDVILIDASTAHRVDPAWVYGMAELSASQRSAIASAHHIANPGCYPTGFLALIRPLRDAGLLDENCQLSVPAVSGYTGGGKGLIEAFEDNSAPVQFSYGHGLSHKHVPEMTKLASLTHAPLFMPSVGDFPQGMLVHVPLFASQFSKNVSGADIAEIYQTAYQDSQIISAFEACDMEPLHNGSFLSADHLANSDRLEIFTFTGQNDNQIWLTARLDNLGKGASGAAIQNMNIALGLDETIGLSL